MAVRDWPGGGNADDIGETWLPAVSALRLPSALMGPSVEAYRKSDSSAICEAPFGALSVFGVEGTCPTLATLPMNHDCE